MPAPEIRSYAAEQVRGVDAQRRRITVVISTYDLDSHGTRIDQGGWDFSSFRTNPVVPLAHDDRGYTGSNGLPVGKGIPDSIRVENQRTLMDIEFPPTGVFPLADTVFELARNGFINAVSVGFEPLDWEDVDEGEGGQMQRVRIFRRQRLLEVSIVTIPSNSSALIQRAQKLNRDEDVEEFRAMARKVEELPSSETDPIRWNRSLSTRFDVAEEKIPPSQLVYDWVSKHIDCEVKEVFQNGFVIPYFRFGGVLSGMKQAFLAGDLTDVRNLTWQGTEEPPVYNVIQLNSRHSDDFLVDGVAFYTADEGNFAYRVYPTWGGLHVDVFTHREAKDFNRRLVDEAWQFARENNPLKGEAFALSGEFIRQTDETWDDCFLEQKNQKALTRIRLHFGGR